MRCCLTKNVLTQVQAIEMYGVAQPDFLKSETNGGIKNIISHHLKIIKRCVFSPNLEGVAQKISLPCPWPFQTSQGRGRLIFWATPSKFGEKIHLLIIFKWCEIMFLIPPLVSDLRKSGWAAPYIYTACTCTSKSSWGSWPANKYFLLLIRENT